MQHALRPVALMPFVVLLMACEPPPVTSASSAPVASAEAAKASASQTPASGRPSAAPSAPVIAPSVLAPSGSASAQVASAEPVAPALDLAEHPRLVDDAGQPLGQTDDRPSTESPAFRRRMQLLLDAIVAGDASLAEPVFFPKLAYEQVKDIPKPGADWKHRLWRAFERDIRRAHRKLGAEVSQCHLTSVGVDDKRVSRMERGKEGNKLPYHRVTRSKIRCRTETGDERTIDVTSLIAWRGEWFVVHLTGFS